MNDLKAFIAGFASALVFHQGTLALLYAEGLTARAPYVTAATWPFHVPAVISLAASGQNECGCHHRRKNTLHRGSGWCPGYRGVFAQLRLKTYRCPLSSSQSPLNMKVVETEEQAHFLRLLNCDQLQGYLVGILRRD